MAKHMLGSWMLACLSPIMAFGQASDQWPVRFTANGDRYQVFMPQPERLEGIRCTLRAAVALQRNGAKEPVFGAIRGDGVLEIDRSTRQAMLVSFTIADARFPGMEDAAQLAALRGAVERGLVAHAGPIDLDWLESALEEDRPSGGEAYRNDPPRIIHRDRPGALVFIDGPAQYERMQETMALRDDPVYAGGARIPIERVINTPFLILRPQGGDHFLHGSGLWFSAHDVDGPWRRTDDVPAELRAMVERMDTTAALTAASAPVAAVPEIVVTHEPAELLDTDGPARMQPVQGTDLLYVTNTDKHLFLHITSQQYYLLASGRWFTTKDLDSGPWTHVAADALPQGFLNIPEGSTKADVLAHVSGTDAAREAALDATIPQTARVDRRTATVTVTYDGAPAFEQIAGTAVDHARNASTTVLRINGRYFVCDKAVWFEGDTPDGPWTVCDHVPTEVNTLPPGSAVYNTRYVYVYDSTPDMVLFGYTPGYLGCYVQGGVVIYGTGYYYPPWPGFWRPRPWTWGFNMFYDPWVGWGFGWGWGWNWFHPWWGWYGRRPWGWGWWGPWGYHPYCWNHYYAYHDHHVVVAHRPAMNATGRNTHEEGITPVRPANLYAGGARPGVRPSAMVPAVRPMTGGDATPAMKPIRRDHFTDAAGNIYRYDGGKPERYDGGRWRRVPPADRPSPAAPPIGGERPGREVKPQRPRDPFIIQRQRSRGTERSRQYKEYQRSWSAPQRTAPRYPVPRGGGRPSAPAGGGGSKGGRGRGRR
jgi:hypothetical protein